MPLFADYYYLVIVPLFAIAPIVLAVAVIVWGLVVSHRGPEREACPKCHARNARQEVARGLLDDHVEPRMFTRTASHQGMIGSSVGYGGTTSWQEKGLMRCTTWRLTNKCAKCGHIWTSDLSLEAEHIGY